jgi:hypothetical protein
MQVLFRFMCLFSCYQEDDRTIKDINQDEMCFQVGARPKVGWHKPGEIDEIPKKTDGCSIMQSAYITDDGLLYVDQKGLEHVNEVRRERGAPPLEADGYGDCKGRSSI